MASEYFKKDVISHTRRVCALYKAMCRDVQYDNPIDFFDARFLRLVVRSKFDQNKDIKDMRLAKAKLVEAEKQFEKDMNPYHRDGYKLHPFSKEGISYNRYELSPDFIMDWYHPLEKQRYPHYFAKREEMKQEYLRLWNKKMKNSVSGELQDKH